ncbi:inaD-like protein [Cololabis saira]|uniref:inaD-like protein n=1 Tax=Cololabis saira TaxID=129043 RepID=UPI002AD52272|nr:inaD-like protein [Cololabis saira]
MNPGVAYPSCDLYPGTSFKDSHSALIHHCHWSSLSIKLNFQQQVVSSHYLQECRTPDSSPSARTGCQPWAVPGCLQREPQTCPASSSSSACGHCSVEYTKETGPAEAISTTQLPVGECLFHHQVDGSKDSRTFPHPRGVSAGPGLRGNPRCHTENSSVTGCPKSSVVTRKSLPQDSLTSQVPLKLQIKVSGQRGGLGISIAGGKGSLPFKDHDEGIFISRVAKGGPSEKAGIHVGDRLFEVNGIAMQGATHHEAVSALRNAGSCIKMKVLRDRLVTREVSDMDVPQNRLDLRGCGQDSRGLRSKQFPLESADDRSSKKIEVVVCNGNDSSDAEKQTAPELDVEVFKKSSLQSGKQTMTVSGKRTFHSNLRSSTSFVFSPDTLSQIPRIILTHPSTSDEDVELLTHISSREKLRDLGSFDKRVYPNRFSSTFNLP